MKPVANEKTLNLESLGDLDNGTAGMIVARELQRASLDVDENGDDGAKRKVVIQIEMQKKDGKLCVHVAAQAKLPPKRTKDVPARTKKDRGACRLLFEDMGGDEDAPDAPPDAEPDQREAS